MLGKKSRSQGFTLIELLVVIAIIAILAAILFPVFIQVKAAGRTASCQSNMKQLGMAIELYADANDGRLPNYSFGSGPTKLFWWSIINPYLKADKVYRCTELLDSKIPSTTGLYARTYGYGVNYPHVFPGGNAPRSPKAGAIPRPTRTMLLCDAYTMEIDYATRRMVEAGFPAVYCRDKSHNWTYSAQYLPDGNIAGRHGGRSNIEPYGKTVVLYCDQHVKVWPKVYLTKEYASPSESDNGDIWGHYDRIEY